MRHERKATGRSLIIEYRSPTNKYIRLREIPIDTTTQGLKQQSLNQLSLGLSFPFHCWTPP